MFADWELDLRPLESGSADIFSAPDPMADINLTRFDGRVHQLGSTPAGHYTIGILTSPRYTLQWNGYSVSDSCIEVFAPGDEYDSVGPGGFSALTVSVAQEILDCLAEDLGVESLSSLTGARHWYGEPLTHRSGAAQGQHPVAPVRGGKQRADRRHGNGPASDTG